jgi:energy-converting hydrogenase A subunit M
MKPEYDFSRAERGKFYRANVEFRFPVHLEPDVDEFISVLAEKRKMGVQKLANSLLRADREIIREVSGKSG